MSQSGLPPDFRLGSGAAVSVRFLQPSILGNDGRRLQRAQRNSKPYIVHVLVQFEHLFEHMLPRDTHAVTSIFLLNSLSLLCCCGIVATLCHAPHGSHHHHHGQGGGGGGGPRYKAADGSNFTRSEPPFWDPAHSRDYSFRAWMRDLQHWMIPQTCVSIEGF